MKTRYLILLTILSAAFPHAPARAADRPNILFIFADDHAYQAVSAYGYGFNETPNIDRIGREGMRFDRCLVPNSICGPSRATVMTGKYSHINRFYNNTNSRFDGSQVTMPKLLQSAGYATAMIGKWHLVSDPTGFDYWEILPGQGQYYNPPMIRNGERVKHEGYTTEVITDIALDWLKNKRDKSKPFLMMCHHKAPHREWEPALKYLTKYDNVKFPEPPTLFDDYAGRGRAEHEQDMMVAKTMNQQDLKLVTPKDLNEEQKRGWEAYYGPRNEAFQKANLEGKDLVRWKYQRYMHDYLSCIASVDESVGKLLDYLKEAGLEKNTIVVYASDQGFYLGEHGWFDKRWIFEESLRTACLMRWPGVAKPGSTSKEIVSNVDFAETFLDAAGVNIPAEMQGHSLKPVLAGHTPADWRKSFYYHYYEHSEDAKNPGPHNVARHYGVVTDRYKLVYFYEPAMNYWELFDLQKDPRELKSVFGRPDYAKVQAELEGELKRLRVELKVPDQDPAESNFPRPGQGKEKGKPNSRIFERWLNRNPNMNKTLLGTTLAIAGLASFLTGSCSALAASRPPNIVYILADDLGYTDVACYGSKYYETPNIDRLATQGMKFTQYHNCQNCQPTRASLMSGQYGPRTGVYTVGGIGRFEWQGRPLRPVDNVTSLPLDKITIAQSLKAAGYATGMFGKWHLGNEGGHHPAKRGFDEAIVSMGAHFDFVTNPKVDYPKGQYLADFLTDKAVDFIQRHKDGPFFLYLPHFAVHAPHNAKPDLIAHFKPKPGVGGHNNPTYAAMIASVDESVGRVMKQLDDLKLTDNTVLIFSSDNGGVGGYVREGIKQAGDVTDNFPLRSGKGSLYEGGIRDPFIIRWPGVVKPGSKCDAPSIHVDLYPTFLEIAGAQRPAGYTLDGESLVPQFRNGLASLKRDAIFEHFPGYLGAGAGSWRTTPVGTMQMGDWKLMEFFEDGKLELYNLREDIGESKNLAKEMPDRAKELHAKMLAWREEIKAPMPTPNKGESPAAATKAGKKKKGKAKADADQDADDDDDGDGF